MATSKRISCSLAVISLLFLAGCTSDADNEQSTSSSQGSSQSDSTAQSAEAVPTGIPDMELDEVETECVDGTATVVDANANVEVVDCENVVIDASNSVIELGQVTNVTINGLINSVSAKTAKTVTVTGDGNLVTVSNETEVDDQAEQTEIVVE